MKKLYGIIFALCIFLLPGVMVNAAGQSARPVVALGADLSADQRAKVLEQMGLSEADLANCNVITITNDQEHQYLDSYIDSSVIGTRSLSSVMLTKAEEGNGVLVSTKNINYCTTGMYRNALLTAGLTDTNVLVVGPSPISGTAALVGAVKAYEVMADISISDKTLDTAINEMVTTGKLEESSENDEEVEELVAFVKAKLAAGELKTDQDMLKAIQEGEGKFHVSLTDDEKQQIINVMHKINELGLDPELLLNQAQDLYKKFGTDIVNHTEDVIKESVNNSVKSYFSKMTDRVATFVKGLFK